MCFIGKYWKTVFLLLKFCSQTLQPLWNILYILQYRTIYCVISVPGKIIHNYSSLSYVWERIVYSLLFIIFHLAEGSFRVALPVPNCLCTSAKPSSAGRMDLEESPHLLSRGCTLLAVTLPRGGFQSTSWWRADLQMWVCRTVTQQTSPEGKIT